MPWRSHLAVTVCAAAKALGVPSNMMRPPLFPPSGPNSITQSLAAMKSKLCSMMMTELPLLTRS